MNRSILFHLLFLFPMYLTAQHCDDCRYISYQFDSVVVTTEQFGQGINSDGINQQLMMDIYQPYGDTVTNRPLVIFAFGGGFINGTRTEEYVVNGCRRFARAGYVAAAIDYRIGFDLLGLFPNPTQELMRVFFRAMQDMRGSIQWFRHNADLGGNVYRINPDMVLAGGASAGAITALMMTYCDDSTEFAEIGNLNALNALGPWNSSSGTYQNYSWAPQGVFNIAGAIVNTDWIRPGDPPLVSTHGDEDNVVPYQGGNLDFGFTAIGLEGSYNVDVAARAAGVCSYLYTIPGGDHPSGNAPEEFYDAIYLRSLPRARAVIEGQSFCCPLAIDVQPDDIQVASLNEPFTPTLVVANDSGNAQSFYCSSVCVPGNQSASDDLIAHGTTEHFYLIGVAYEGNCLATDFNSISSLPIPNVPATQLTDFEVAPVPATTEIVFRPGTSLPGVVRLVLYDPRGTVIAERTAFGPESRFSVAQLPRGAYLLEVQHRGKSGFRRLLLQ
ncbi:MAG: alpha/beta hydrolase [Bacteroidota bacterium]